MSLGIFEKDCCGCSACTSVCPVHCISMIEGTLGHLLARVDHSSCISCGLCKAVCPMIAPLPNKNFEQKAYMSYASNQKIRFNGSSGGVFETFANVLFHNGYIVYGAAFSQDLKLQCTLATDSTTLRPLLKSKYLQSNMQGKFEEIKKFLDESRKVLFISTPCQVMALLNFLHKQYPNLITIDLLCHGVPSQRFFDECIAYEEKKRRITMVSYSFRTKVKHGSTPHYFTEVYLKNGKRFSRTRYYFDSIFYACFQRYINLRESCYNCRFALNKHCADITIGDFHDVAQYIRDIDRFQGVSIVVVNSVEGESLWSDSQQYLSSYEVNLTQLINDGICFSGATKRPKDRDSFCEAYDRNGIEGVVRDIVKPRSYFKHRVYYSLPRGIRDFIKTTLRY